MSRFKDVVVKYKDQEHTIAAKKLMPIILEVEHIVDLTDFTSGEIKKFGALSKAYASVLRHAGCKESDLDEEIYFSIVSDGDVDMIVNATMAVVSVLSAMNPSPDYRPEQKQSGKPKGRSKKKA